MLGTVGRVSTPTKVLLVIAVQLGFFALMCHADCQARSQKGYMAVSQRIDGKQTARLFDIGQICFSYPDEARADFIGSGSECQKGPCEYFQCNGCKTSVCWRFVATSGASSEYSVQGGEIYPNSNPPQMGNHFTSFEVAKGQDVCFSACIGCQSDFVQRSESGLEGELLDLLPEQTEEKTDEVADPPLFMNMTDKIVGQGN
ncbi:hypothetical protein M9434_004371 [Picochlorum sp. BPE23]|nr:hypothetical protein M9434_004371 [Picochlorum sp. BPE23]